MLALPRLLGRDDMSNGLFESPPRRQPYRAGFQEDLIECQVCGSCSRSCTREEIASNESSSNTERAYARWTSCRANSSVRSALWRRPPRTTTASARPSKLDPFTLLIDEILLIDLDATRKQRHTVTPDLPPSDRRALLVRGVALTNCTRTDERAQASCEQPRGPARD